MTFHDFHYKYYNFPAAVDDSSEEELRRRNSTSNEDHGERTNAKLKTQPFYHRNRNGKMKHY
jgi:hypothetical protein